MKFAMTLYDLAEKYVPIPTASPLVQQSTGRVWPQL